MNTKKSPVPVDLKKAVDWKIFQIQSSLISEHATDSDIDNSLVWFQPIHYSEVMEERNNENHCGFPLCNNSNSNNRSHGTDSSPYYRISYDEKKVYEVGKSVYYCSSACYEKGCALEKRYSSSLPYSRAAVHDIDVSQPINSSIDELISLLDFSEKHKKSNHVEHNKALDEFSMQPPSFACERMNDAGNVLIEFKQGLPCVTKSHQSSVTDGETPSNVKERSDRENSVPNSPVKRNLPSKSDHAIRNNDRLAPTLESELSSVNQRKSLTESSDDQLSPGRASASTDDVPMDEIISTMNELRTKHLSQSSIHTESRTQDEVAVNEVRFQSKQFTSRKDLQGNEASKAAKSDTKSDVSRRPGPKSVHWNDGKRSMKKSNQGASSVMNVRIPIKERKNVAPLPESALLSKQIVSINAGDNASDLGDGNDAGENIDTMEAATSIEGYVAALQKSLSIAPHTAIRELSYHPFERRDRYRAKESGSSQESKENTNDEELSDSGSELVVDNVLENKSFFLTMWTTLDELFDHTNLGFLRIASEESDMCDNPKPPDVEEMSAMPPQPDNAIQSKRIIDRFRKGFSRSEQLLAIQYNLGEVYLKLYLSMRDKLFTDFSNALVNRVAAIDDIKNDGHWSFLGLLLIDVMVKKIIFNDDAQSDKKAATDKLITSKDSSDQGSNYSVNNKNISILDWDNSVNVAAARLLGGGSTAESVLRPGDLQTLRNFFDYSTQ